ncbi:hypothetical protein T12_11703 [Trichinella patagoniensis]|uniref:Uncharacterized protein n=1 Tax=Trichinella patagoniensis TaxID=990121 RepID=A0A0V0ZAX4_9BILA|nr:hypothetical protein T12_11703 [Trichinella patagoniensis]
MEKTTPIPAIYDQEAANRNSGSTNCQSTVDIFRFLMKRTKSEEPFFLHLLTGNSKIVFATVGNIRQLAIIPV